MYKPRYIIKNRVKFIYKNVFIYNYSGLWGYLLWFIVYFIYNLVYWFILYMFYNIIVI